MEKYIKQLLADMQAAHRLLSTEETDEAETFEQHIEEVERYLSGADDIYQHSFSYQCGVKKEQFPPADQLTSDQLNVLCNAFEKLLYSWNAHATLPKELPVAMAYDVLLSVLDREFMIVTSGFVGLEFCDYLPEKCVFKAYCTCKELFEEMDEEKRLLEVQVQQLLKDLATALQTITAGTFSSMYHLSLDEPRPTSELQSIAEWLALSIEDFPVQYKLNTDQLEAISDALLAFWDKEDDIHIWVGSVNPSTKYRSLVTFLQTKVWCTENGLLIYPPIDPEELQKIKNSIDNLHLRDLLDFSEDDFEDDLPF